MIWIVPSFQNIGHRRLLRACIVGLALLPMLATPGALLARPLLVEGKKTVFQRVLTRPGAQLVEGPISADPQELQPFEPFYVFERQGDWLRVGRIASAEPEGWLRADAATEWRQNIVATFTNPANRSRQLIFSDLASLQAHLNAADLAEGHQALLQEADAGRVREGSGVISVEPVEHIDIREQFYTMPILGFVEEFHPLSYSTTILMNVASLPLKEPEPPADDMNAFDIGVVFAIDTTRSMRPYFDVMRDQVQDLVERTEGSEIGNRVNFGIIAFRDDPSGRVGVDYRTREVLPLRRRESQDEVIAALADLEEAQGSTSTFNEDSLSGVAQALYDTDWDAGEQPFAGRFVVLVTDAGPKLPGQDGTIYENAPEDLQAAAEAQQVAILALHLKTAAGADGNHDYAAEQYSALTEFDGNDHYFPIEEGSPEAFAAATQRLVTFFRDQVAQMEGLAPELSDEETGESLTELGRAIRLQYLGSERGTAAPEVFDGWLSSLSEDDGERQAVSFRLLVTRNELATMADLVEEFVRIGGALGNDEDLQRFHSDIRAAVLRMSQDPNRLVDPDAEGIGDAMEFLEDLPYQSVLLRTSQDRWLNNPGERQVVMDGLASKLRTYRRWLSSSEVWVPLFDGAPDSEWVSALPVEFLP